jgi:hypothetical protein
MAAAQTLKEIIGCDLPLEEKIVLALAQHGNDDDITICDVGHRHLIPIAIAMLCNGTSPRTLCLRRNNIGTEGIAALAAALRNSSLKTLNLWDDTIGAEGAAALADALKENLSLQTLHLWNNNIGAEGAVALADALKGNSHTRTISDKKRGKKRAE